MAAKSSIIDIDTQIEKLRERKKLLIVKSADRFARAATKAGLAEMAITDEEVDHIVEEIAARFRERDKKEARGGNTAPHRQTNGGAGTTAEVSHDS
ncbi:TraC family protein [Brucella pituitosa]|uniref:TraC family protein n=1 Tax=Brucella pituitosa TaxID=571256 RepID=UPI000CFE40F0|nr:pilus assembly protein [Ochrobactrum sp. MYb68]